MNDTEISVDKKRDDTHNIEVGERDRNRETEREAQKIEAEPCMHKETHRTKPQSHQYVSVRTWQSHQEKQNEAEI